MKARQFLFGLFINALFIFNNSILFADENEYENDYSPTMQMDNFIPDNLATIRNSIKKYKNIDAKYINNDLAIMVNRLYGVPHAKEKIKKPSFLILFSVPHKKDIQSDTTESLKDFMNGKTDNVKEIFWPNRDNPFSWSKATEELKFEKKCICGCVTGIFSSRLCLMSECPLAKTEEK